MQQTASCRDKDGVFSPLEKDVKMVKKAATTSEPAREPKRKNNLMFANLLILLVLCAGNSQCPTAYQAEGLRPFSYVLGGQSAPQLKIKSCGY